MFSINIMVFLSVQAFFLNQNKVEGHFLIKGFHIFIAASENQFIQVFIN